MFPYKLIQTQEHKKLKDELASLQNEIEEANQFVKALRQDSLEAQFQGAKPPPESLASNLIDMQTELIRLAEQEKQRNWVTEGLAKFSDLLRDDYEDIRTLGNAALSHLIKYLGANQGGLFILNEENEEDIFLEMIACYAYDRQKYLKKKVRVREDYAEGLIGQAFLERQSIYMTDIPLDYINITSGLGDAPPRTMLIAPLVTNEDVYGIVEIASFRDILPYQQEFVEKVGENIASTILSAKISERTRYLLEATREQTDALRAQEEELRQNMEELQTTQEEMRRVNRELEYTFSAIDSSMLAAEFTAEGEIYKVNQKFQQFLGYDKDEIIGQKHQMLVLQEERDSAEYQEFWEKLRQGQSFTGEFRRIAKNGFVRWIRGAYYPVRNQENKIVKVLKIAYDITLEKEQEIKLFEQQRVIEQNHTLMKDRIKSIQDKAYEQIKALKQQLKEKQEVIDSLGKKMNGHPHIDSDLSA